jgi:hypothetical protein
MQHVEQLRDPSPTGDGVSGGLPGSLPGSLPFELPSVWTSEITSKKSTQCAAAPNVSTSVSQQARRKRSKRKQSRVGVQKNGTAADTTDACAATHPVEHEEEEEAAAAGATAAGDTTAYAVDALIEQRHEQLLDHVTNKRRLCKGPTENHDVAFNSVAEKIHTLYSAIVNTKQQVHRNQQVPGVYIKDCIQLQSIVSNVSFVDTMQQMFKFESGKGTQCNIPIITRQYEEMYMRESFLPGDVDCVMGNNCECMFIDTCMPFVGTCFDSPLIHASGGAESTPQEPCRMCVLCCRKNTQQLFYDLIFSGVRFNGYIQLYGNICGVDGEYAKEAVLVCPPNGPIACMPLPIVAHQRNRYSVVVNNGVKYIKQHKVYHENFRVPSLSV